MDEERGLRVSAVGGETSVLGGHVRVELQEPFTVLVGRNASGKSAFFDLLTTAVSAAKGGLETIPRFEFEMEFWFREEQFRYTSSVSRSPDSETGPHWQEACTSLDGTQVLWSTDDNVTLIAEDFPVVGEGSITRVDLSTLKTMANSVPAKNQERVDVAIELISTVGRHFETTTMVQPGLPGSFGSQPWIKVKDGSILKPRGRLANGRTTAIARWLVQQHLSDSTEGLDDFAKSMQRVGPSFEIDFRKYSLGEESTEKEHIYAVTFDNIHLENLSDGTLRVIELLVNLQRAPAGTMLLIEEPETGVHPGLLKSIIREVAAFGKSLQIIISTHSTALVDESDASQLRWVRRRNGVTSVSPLSEGTRGVIREFLDNQGTLSEFVMDEDFDDDGDKE